MIHEGPLLEYAGRDLALLQWAIAARHWLVLVLAAALFLPHPGGSVVGSSASLPVALAAALRRARGRRDARREDAHPARAAAARRRGRGRAARRSSPGSSRPRMSGVALDARRARPRRRRRAPALDRDRARRPRSRSLLAARCAQRAAARSTQLVAAAALASAARRARRRCCSSSCARTREPRPVRADAGAARARAAAAVALALLLVALVPPLGLDVAGAERAALALVAFGLVTVATRRRDAVPGARRSCSSRTGSRSRRSRVPAGCRS